MRDASLVGEGERFGRRLDQRNGLLEGARDSALLLLVAQDGLERTSFEPLEDHVGDRHPARRREHPNVARLADRSALLGELREKRAFADEVLEQALAVFGGDLAQRLEDFQCDGALPNDVNRAVDDGESPLPHHALDRVFLGDGGSDKSKRIFV
jgi:hypothetical protein